MSEHLNDARKFSPGSHIIKHWMDHHPASREMPLFKYKIRKTFKDCLTRQTTEAVAIMLHQGDLLNSKNDYLTNCITRVKVEEDAYQRKKRENQEELEEIARLVRVDKFRNEKSITGTKRRGAASINQGEHARKPKKIRSHGPESTNTEMTPSLPLNKHLSETSTILAIECQALNILALQYFPERKIPKEASTQSPLTLNVHSNGQVPPSVPAVKQTMGVKDPRNKNTYITHLYGWSAWWSMVERQNRPERNKAPVGQKLTELEKSKNRFQKSETERLKFMEKFYPRSNDNRPKESYEVEKPKRNVHTEGGCTPKRSRDFDFLEKGEIESRSKKKKVNSNSGKLLNVEDLDRDLICKKHEYGLSGDQMNGT